MMSKSLIWILLSVILLTGCSAPFTSQRPKSIVATPASEVTKQALPSVTALVNEAAQATVIQIPATDDEVATQMAPVNSSPLERSVQQTPPVAFRLPDDAARDVAPAISRSADDATRQVSPGASVDTTAQQIAPLVSSQDDSAAQQAAPVLSTYWDDVLRLLTQASKYTDDAARYADDAARYADEAALYADDATSATKWNSLWDDYFTASSNAKKYATLAQKSMDDASELASKFPQDEIQAAILRLQTSAQTYRLRSARLYLDMLSIEQSATNKIWLTPRSSLVEKLIEKPFVRDLACMNFTIILVDQRLPTRNDYFSFASEQGINLILGPSELEGISTEFKNLALDYAGDYVTDSIEDLLKDDTAEANEGDSTSKMYFENMVSQYCNIILQP